MDMGQKIKHLRIQKGYTQEELGKILGVKKAAIQKYENGTVKNIKRSKIQLLADALDTTPTYIMGWNEENETNHKQPTKVPVLGTVAAGIPIEAIEDIEDYEEISEIMASKGEYFALKIKGESMEPKFSDGDVVIVRKQENIESGEIGVIIVNGYDATVKKVIKQENGIMLIATNQNVYAPKFYSLDDIKNKPVRILGKVVELRAKF